MRPVIEHAISLGTFCHTANHFQQRKIRTCSHPFDWVLSSPAVVLSCLRDDFQTLMNPEHHEHLGENISNHLIYGTQVLGNNFQGKLPQNIMFTHRDITTPEHYDYYQRCVERFRALLATADSKLFVLTTQDADYDRAEIHELYEELQKRTTSFRMLCVSFYNDYNFHCHVEKDPAYDIHYMKFYTYSRTDGRGFAIPHENDLFHDALCNLYDFRADKKVS
uniref:Papain-like cysteine peptidase n=1 Tax=viral metagenome TaxID=1070528 RepID=A0A6C0HJH6_9ZZZZ